MQIYQKLEIVASKSPTGRFGRGAATCGPSMQVVRWLRTLTGLCRMLIVGVVDVDGGLFDLAIAIDRTYGLTNYT